MTDETPAAPARTAAPSPAEDRYGSSRAVAAGDFVLVAGCTARRPDGVVDHEGDPYGQTLAAFAAALDALAAHGLGAADVVRTRMYLTHLRDRDEAARAHKELFDAVRPVTTMVVVQALTDSRTMVEVEVDAHRPGPVRTLEGTQP
ncbi:Rid family hydrolase [Kitasatospora sp. NPDC088391]|uniref:Rid family hydrolase n=1 Tax=Kitasatospora sp. NPDC088391 TaxID=3364074 RepID=UPI00382CEF2C